MHNYSANQPNIPVKFTSTGVLNLPTRLRGAPPSSHMTACNENVQTVAECDKEKLRQDTDVVSVIFGQFPQFSADML